MRPPIVSMIVSMGIVSMGIVPMGASTAGVAIGDEVIAGETWDSEVSAEVEQVERTESPVDDNKVDVGGVGDEQHHALNIGVGEADPEVGSAGIHGFGVGVRSNEVMPATVVILRADVGECFRVVEARLGETEDVDGDAAKVGDDALRFLVGIEIAGEAEHLAVKGEVGVEAGVAAEGAHALGEPVVVRVAGGIGGGAG